MADLKRLVAENKLLVGTLAAVGAWIGAGYLVHHFDKLGAIEEVRSSVPKDGRALNVGAKNWWMFEGDFGDVEVTNIDVVERDVPNFVMADVRNLEMFEDDYFDAVLCSHVLEHVPKEDVPKAVSEMERVVKDEENVFIVLPRPYFLDPWLTPSHEWVPVGEEMVETNAEVAWLGLVGLVSAPIVAKAI